MKFGILARQARLKNYKKFIAHCNTAVYTSKQLMLSFAIDILDEMEDSDDEVYIQSIMRTKERTAIIVRHIKRVLEYYRYTSKKEPEIERRYNVVIGLFIEQKTYRQLSEELYYSTKTIERDRKERKRLRNYQY